MLKLNSITCVTNGRTFLYGVYLMNNQVKIILSALLVSFFNNIIYGFM